MGTEEEVKRWVREEHEAIKDEEQAACSHRVSGTYHGDDLFCDRCGKVITMADHSENGDQRVAHPRIPLQ